MTKHILFLVHGMGDTHPGWSVGLQQLIRARYAGYAKLNLLCPFDNIFRFCEINYNDKFDERRRAWAEHAQTVLNLLAQQGLDAGAVNLLTDYAAETGKDKFLATHVLDVLLYRFIPQIAEQVRTSVHLQIMQALTAQSENETINWSIIAHSLGTAVTHDTLHAMYSGDAALPIGITRPRVVAMIANVSRILATHADVYSSCVSPCTEGGKGICDYFVNVRHRWDPIPVPRMFQPVADWPDDATRRAERFINLLTEPVEQRDVHDFEHYLKNPAVHIALFRALTWRDTIDDATAAQVIAAYAAGTPLAQFQSLITDIQTRWPRDEASWREVIQCFRAFRELVRA